MQTEVGSVNEPSALGRVRAGLAGPGAPGGARCAMDSRHTVGYPIVPVGDAPGGALVEDGDFHTISYPQIAWQIKYPKPAEGERLASSRVLDVYIGLLFLWSSQGFPEDGVVRFSRYEFLHLIGWLSGDGKRKKPRGQHYRRLSGALEYLQGTTYGSPERDEVRLDLDGDPFRGAQRLKILSSSKIAKDRPGRKSMKEPGGDAQSSATLTPEFLKLLAAGGDATNVDLDLYLALSAGTPRILLRLFLWMRQEGLLALPLSEMFARVGSTQQQHVPARARQILRKAHRELEEAGILASPPEYVKQGTEWWVEYSFGYPAVLLAEETMLVDQAVAYGVSAGVARELAIAHRTRMEMVLGAVALGRLHPKTNLAGLIVRYIRRGWPLPTSAVGAPPLQTELGRSSESEYIQWSSNERARRLQRSEAVSAAEVGKKIRARLAHRRGDRPLWLEAGLVAIQLNQDLEIESLEDWQGLCCMAPK